ncbi:MAG: hypothetical protein EA367_12925 [Leptolyngbya sp. DLM2.Bin15]|nr:MAG: hypothetical protein EA367_12925 [Leptolyngbya sp. DLM2.Bin15]
MVARKRISIRFEAEAHTVEGRLLDYLKEHKLLNYRDAIVRATKAYYVPWVYEGELSEEELRSLAQGAIEELEFRIFQIRKHFLGEGSEPVDIHALSPTADRNSTRTEVSRETPTADHATSSTPVRPLSLKDVIDHTNVDPSVLDDF